MASHSYTGPVTIGTRVEVELVDQSGGRERMAFDVVPDSTADFSAGFLGANTPMAQAIVGHRAGDVVPYRLADMAEVRILAVSASQRQPNRNTPAERDAVIRNAISRSDLEDAVRLALTVNVKWGDYDPEGLTSGWDHPEQAPDDRDESGPESNDAP
jgi:hypothetical protein